MAQPYYSLNWSGYENSICSKFSSLQENGDFVDMTLAADGHLVKVHQLILGIASPYIKELIQSAPCKHPVVFLNNISFSTLCSILQYVYTGEAAISEDQLTLFFQAAKSLQIQGLSMQDITVDSNEKVKEMVQDNPGLQTIQVKILGESESLIENVAVPLTAKNIKMSTKPQHNPTQILPTLTFEQNLTPSRHSDGNKVNLADEQREMLENESVTAKCSRNNSVEAFQLTNLVDVPSNEELLNTNQLQYTVSIRGSLQLILNRYIYNLFSKSSGGKVRRWRCVDYKIQKCPACTVTSGDIVVKRVSMHNHHYHDKKILAKIKKRAVYSAINSVQNNLK